MTFSVGTLKSVGVKIGVVIVAARLCFELLPLGDNWLAIGFSWIWVI